MRRLKMKAAFAGVSLFACAAAHAGGFSLSAVPTKIDLVRAEGFMVYGEFGNPAGCSGGNAMFIRANNPDYKLMYAAALAALTSKQKLYGYVHKCEPLSWYSIETYTYNIITMDGTLSITN